MKEIQVHIGRRKQEVQANLTGFLLGGGGVELTPETIEEALGYVPADQESVDKLWEEVDDLKETGTGGGIVEETDPTVPTWAKKPTKPTYTAKEVGALPDTTEIPSNTSDLTNDSGFITKAVNDLANYYLKSETYSKAALDNKISAIPKFSIEVVSSLPTSNISDTTVYLVASGDEEDNLYTEYIYVNGEWEYLGKQTVDLTGYVKRTELSAYYTSTEIDSLLTTIRNSIPTKLSQLTEDSSHRVVTDTEKQSWNAKADKATTLAGYGITDGATKTEVTQLSEEIVDLKGGIPDYWQTALDDGVEAINTALCTAGSNKSAFLFYSDVHWQVGSQMSPRLLKYLYEHTGMTKTFFGGDIVNVEGQDYDTMEYLWDWRHQIKGLSNHHSVVGNHDDGNSTNNLFSEKYVYGYLLAPEETPDIVRGDGLYYYIDNPVEKTRYLFLDTAYKGATAAQQEFVKDALISTHEGWHIVAVSHIWYDTIYTTSPPSVGDINRNASIFLSMFDNYNNRSGDYADCGGWVEFCIGGHTHRDYDGTSESGIPIILVETDSRDVRNGKTDAQYKYVAGTNTESSVNGIIADYDNRKIYVVRVGRGESRDIVITNYVITYTNQIPISTDASGAVYNGKGFKENTRLGSDGSERVLEGIDVTGFIPCTIADTLYFKNCEIVVKNGSVQTYQEMTCCDSSKTLINKRMFDYATHMSGKDYSVDESNNLTRYNCADLWTNTAFVRISGNYIGADSIITVNQPIE